MMLAMFNQYEDMFLLQPSEVYCVLPNQHQIINSSLCFATIQNNGTEHYRCNKWHLKFLWVFWLKKTWLVFCDKKLKMLSTAIISRFGIVFGCIIFGLVSDSFGRRTAIIFNVFAELTLGLVITFCDAEGWFRLIAFLKSLFGSAGFYMGLILTCEIASNRWRSWLCVIVMSPRLLTIACMVPLANSAPNSETFSFISCIYALFCLVLIRWIPESPQWLMYNRQISTAERILIKAAKINNIELCQDFKIRPINHRVRLQQDINDLVMKVFCCITVFGCLTKCSSLKLTLRYLLLVHVVITGVSTAGVIFIFKGTIHCVLSTIALGSGLVAHALILNMTPRLFAINIRATVVGCCHATGQLGSIVSYLLFLFHPISNIAMVSIELCITMILAGLCLMYPDVDRRELPDVMTDMDYFSELSKPLRWVTQKTSSPSLEEMEIMLHSFGTLPSTSSLPEEIVPARQIGCVKFWKIFINYVRRKCSRKITQV
uniref:Major facilitator superfamily (MFS) profile domain-containing protein n=1 Tax=Heliothis virescens TaxID=7102 RepID=A0A2A4J4J6_HELVI